jgi:hydroxymethylpyrimidine/phosphomethylpyrimidine kinase
MTAAVCLTVAGSDPSGGAGIQADLKTFSALGAYGTAVVTALTAQSTRGVTGVHAVPAEFVALQLRTLLDDVQVHATKLGMLGTASVVRAVARLLSERRPGPIICDPVMIATSGDRLIDDDAIQAVRTELLPVTDLITPNVPEAAALLDVPPATGLDTLQQQAVALLDLGPRAVLLKGGHLRGPDSVDVLATSHGVSVTRRSWIETTATHGTGCTLSSAIAALAARDPAADWLPIIEQARTYLQRALKAGHTLGIGSGHGPVHHFAGIWQD